MKTVSIECLYNEEDRELLLPFVYAYFEETGAYSKNPVHPADRKDRAYYTLLERGYGAYAILTDRGVAGYVLTKYFAHGKAHPLKPLLYIAHFYVMPEERKKGIGEEAFRDIMQVFKPKTAAAHIYPYHACATAFISNVMFRLGWERKPIVVPENDELVEDAAMYYFQQKPKGPDMTPMIHEPFADKYEMLY